MAWNAAYWDSLFNTFWDPRRIGLDPVPFERSPDKSHVQVPAEYAAKARLRHRARSFQEVRDSLTADERTLNDFLDIMFSIAPDKIIRSWLCEPLGIGDEGPFRTWSLLELTERFGWGNENTTQHDLFITSPGAVICVEIKLKAPSSLEQIVKYACLITLEEKQTGRRPEVGLLYIIPQGRKANWWSSLKLPEGIANRTILERPLKLNRFVKRMLERDGDHLAGTLDRMRLAVVSWSELHARAAADALQLNQTDPGQQTLYRLLDGFVAQLCSHRGTDIIPS